MKLKQTELCVKDIIICVSKFLDFVFKVNKTAEMD